MRKQRVVSLVLGAILLAGCATHRNPVAADGRAPATDDEVGAIVADVWYTPGRGDRDNCRRCYDSYLGAVLRVSL